MSPWERRLKDLSIILENCEKYYFEPELFRLNLNNFLQISRTVTFIIQKNKASLPGFEDWYSEIQKEWTNDVILRWAKDSRNTIEKEGDLELYSSINASLICSYIESEDIKISIPKEIHLFSALNNLLGSLKEYGGDLTSDEWVIKVERRWIANSLPDEELIYVMTYLYSKMYGICDKISKLRNGNIDSSIPRPLDYHTKKNKSKKTVYFDGEHENAGEMIYRHFTNDENAIPNAALLERQKRRWQEGNSFESLFEILTCNAIELFTQDGYHIPSLYVFNNNNELIEFFPLIYEKRYKKFIVWRDIAERISYMDFSYLIFITESWIKKMNNSITSSIVKLENVGEVLTIEGLKKDGLYTNRSFKIIRDNGRISLSGEVGWNIHDIPSYLQMVLNLYKKRRG